MKENESAEKMSRRVFLSKSGKLIGLGFLSHFVLIGSPLVLNALDSEEEDMSRKTCQNYRCLYDYTCTTESPHDCKNKFSCGFSFSCTNGANLCGKSNGINTCSAQFHPY